MCKEEIILVGGGGHCCSCIDIIEREEQFKIAGIIEKKSTIIKDSVMGYDVIGYDTDLVSLRKKFKYALISVGQVGAGFIREKLFCRLKELGFYLPVVASPSSIVSKHAVVGEGTIVMHHVVVNSGAKIGKNCILNTKSLIEHGVVVGDGTHIATSAVINGESVVGSRCFIGSNATLVNGVTIPDDYFFKAAALIVDKKAGTLMQKRGEYGGR